MAPTKDKGKYRCRKKGKYNSCDFKDFSNTWNFFGLMMSKDSIVHSWLRKRGLILTQYICPASGCGHLCEVYSRPKKKDGSTLRCTGKKHHEYGIRKNSFFEQSHYSFQDLLNFLRCFLQGDKLVTMSEKTGMAYKTTGVAWAHYVRRIFKQYIYENVHGLSYLTFSGIIEIDESLFGRRVKFHTGNPNIGLKVSAL